MNNPIAKAIIAALSAAHSELTTPEAIQWYKDTLAQTYLVLSTIAVCCYQLIEAHLLTPTEAEAPLATPEPTPALAIHNIPVLLLPSGGATSLSQKHLLYRR